MDHLNAIRAFITVAEIGSFAGAARRLHVANSVISKRVRELEDHLGAMLIRRTTRRLSLTDTGYAYLEEARRLLGELDGLETNIRERDRAAPCGTLRISAPVSFGIHYLSPAITDFLHKYDRMDIQVDFNDAFTDIVQEGFDLAIRIGTLADTSLIARKLAVSHGVICAAPDYLEKFGTPQDPSELSAHNCLGYTYMHGGRRWSLSRNGTAYNQPINGRFSCNNGEVLCQMAVNGCGIVMLPTFIVGPELKSGRLIPILDGAVQDELPIYAVYPHRKHLAAGIRAFIDHMAAFLGQTSL